MNRFLSEPRRDSPILLLAMDWEEEVMRENDAPGSDSLENDWLPCNRLLASPTFERMLFLVHLFFRSYAQAVGLLDYFL